MSTNDLKLTITTTRKATLEEVKDLIWGTGALSCPWWHSVETLDHNVFDFRYDDPDEEEGTFTGKRQVTAEQILAAASQFLAEGRGGEDAREALSDSIGYLDASAADCVLQRAVLGREIYG